MSAKVSDVRNLSFFQLLAESLANLLTESYERGENCRRQQGKRYQSKGKLVLGSPGGGRPRSWEELSHPDRVSAANLYKNPNS